MVGTLYEPECNAVWKHRDQEGPGAGTPSRAREKQSYGCERDDSPEAERCKSWCQLYIIKWQHSEMQGKLYCLPIKMIVNRMMDYVFDKYSHLLAHLNQPWLSRDRLRHFAATIHDKGAPLENCWGFIDETVRPLCKPDQNQRILYNGHKGCMG